MKVCLPSFGECVCVSERSSSYSHVYNFALVLFPKILFQNILSLRIGNRFFFWRQHRHRKTNRQTMCAAAVFYFRIVIAYFLCPAPKCHDQMISDLCHTHNYHYTVVFRSVPKSPGWQMVSCVRLSIRLTKNFVATQIDLVLV